MATPKKKGEQSIHECLHPELSRVDELEVHVQELRLVISRQSKMLFELKNYIDDIGLRIDVHAVKLSDIRDKEAEERDK